MTKQTKTLKPQTKQAATSTTQPSELLTVAEVARILRVDGTTIRRWVKIGALEAVVLPHLNKRQQYRIARATLDKVVGKSEHAS
jgi:excisionase family DNA binding protein